MKRITIFLLAVITIVVFTVLGYLIITYYSDQSFQNKLEGLVPWHLQILWGAIYGFLAAYLGWKITQTPPLRPTREFFTNLIKPMRLTLLEITFISFCAGVGEEVLFRGAIQPFLGIWLTSFIFVLIHGYINPGNWPLTIYGLYMILVVAGLGFLTIQLGLIASIAAHTVLDMVLLSCLAENRLSKFIFGPFQAAN